MMQMGLRIGVVCGLQWNDDVFVFPHLLVFFIELRIPDFIHVYDFAQSESYRRYNQLE